MSLGFAGRGDFLHNLVAQQIAGRLDEILRDFRTIAIIGCGSGELARLISSARPDCTIDQIDLGPARAAAAGARHTASLDPLPLDPGGYDLVISVLELHWQNDPVGQLVQMRRALRPDGLMLATMFGGQTLVELRAAMAEAEVEMTGGLSPRIAPMGELRDLGRTGPTGRSGDARRRFGTVRYDLCQCAGSDARFAGYGRDECFGRPAPGADAKGHVGPLFGIVRTELPGTRRPGASDLRGDFSNRLGSWARSTKGVASRIRNDAPGRCLEQPGTFGRGKSGA